MDKSSLPDHVEVCYARVSGPDDPEFCTEPAVFEIIRLLDTALISCPGHLGPLLLGANNVVWPPEVRLLEPGEHPKNVVVTGSAEAKRRETEFKEGLGLVSGEEPLSQTDPQRLTEALLALGTSCPAAGAATSAKDVPVLLGALLAAVEAGLISSGHGGPESVEAVVRGYESASVLLDAVGWATVLHMRFARNAAEIDHVLDSELGHTAAGAAHLASGLLRLEQVAGGRNISRPDGGTVPVKDLYQSSKKILAQVRSAMDGEVRQELSRAGHRV